MNIKAMILGIIERDKVIPFEGAMIQNSDRLEMELNSGRWLHIAAACGSLKIVQYLVSVGQDVNMHSSKVHVAPIALAAHAGHLPVVTFLRESGAAFDVSTPERNPLFEAIRGGHLDVARYLIDNGIDLTVSYTNQDMQNMDAMAFAKEHDRAEIVEMLAAKNIPIPSGSHPGRPETWQPPKKSTRKKKTA